MKRSILIPVISMVAAIVVLLTFWQYLGEAPQSGIDDGSSRAAGPQRETGDAPSTEPGPATELPAVGPNPVQPQRIRDLELALEAATNERELAEAALLQSEAAVAELERFVEEIEARGEDPADYADEGLEKFIPAFDAYQRAADRLELAEQMELDAQRALDRARAEGRSRQTADPEP